MAKVVVVGNAVVITSAVKWEDLETIKKYRPEALTLTEGEEKTPVFLVDVSGCSADGEISKYGATFGSATHDDEGLATITKRIVEVGKASKEEIMNFITDDLGGALIKLERLEKKLPNVLEEIEEEKAAIEASITIA